MMQKLTIHLPKLMWNEVENYAPHDIKFSEFVRICVYIAKNTPFLDIKKITPTIPRYSKLNVSVRAAVMLEPETLRWVEEQAVLNGISRVEVVRRAIRFVLDEEIPVTFQHKPTDPWDWNGQPLHCPDKVFRFSTFRTSYRERVHYPVVCVGCGKVLKWTIGNRALIRLSD